ncbi:MAG: cytidine deaminase [Defluviitaleaceae bacterium]|nr:cytidine deaminase [Defluviitaleaceae bacterium]
MDGKNIEQKMFDEAVKLINKRYPKGWGGAGVIRTEDGMYFTSVYLEAMADVSLCIETGAMCEAHKHDTRVTHSLCVVRNDENSKYEILTPCGVCQERLRFWGNNVMVGVTTPDNTIKFVSLAELQPYHWTTSMPVESLENYDYFQNKKLRS